MCRNEKTKIYSSIITDCFQVFGIILKTIGDENDKVTKNTSLITIIY
jgi:hypothetical protein